MLALPAKSTGLVLIDLQNGIVSAQPRAPYSSEAVVEKAKALAGRFRDARAPVFLVHVGFAADFSDTLQQPVDSPTPRLQGDRDQWFALVDGLEQPGDIVIHKRNWGAFYGTDLDLQLRRRGIETIVLGGIATNFGVESTARDAWERNYALVVVEDACTSGAAEAHEMAFKYVFPHISRVTQSDQISLV